MKGSIDGVNSAPEAPDYKPHDVYCRHMGGMPHKANYWGSQCASKMYHKVKHCSGCETGLHQYKKYFQKETSPNDLTCIYCGVEIENRLGQGGRRKEYCDDIKCKRQNELARKREYSKQYRIDQANKTIKEAINCCFCGVKTKPHKNWLSELLDYCQKDECKKKAKARYNKGYRKPSKQEGSC